MFKLESLEPFLSYSAAELQEPALRGSAWKIVDEFLTALEAGKIRSAILVNGQWNAQPLVKQGILLAFRVGKLTSCGDSSLPFVDKDTFPVRTFTPEQQIRIVPGGSSVRRGAYLAPSVVMMPPAYVNVGAFVDEGSLIDSHALVGSCAQVGKRVHLSAAAQLGGVLEPIGARPVVIEDDVFIGGNTGIYEGTLVRKRAVIAAGVILTSSTIVYDLPNAQEITTKAGEPLEIPEGAVVVPGARPAKGEFAKQHGISLATPVIVKYRDAKTDAKAALETTLRS